MRFHGRNIDPISVWEHYVTLPPGTKVEDTFTPKVQCPNPNHDTLKSHFQVNLTQPTVHCFALCGISGSWEHAICVIEGLYEKYKVEDASNERERKRRRARAIWEARKTILRLAKPSSYRRKSRIQKNSGSRETTSTVPAESLAYEKFLPPVALSYIGKRKFSDNSISKWGIGWLPEEKRLVIPAHDLNGTLRFLIKRAVMEKQSPKYLYTEGFPKSSLLFGACFIDLGMLRSDGLILVEGSLDVIRFHQHGLTNTGGILGTGISDQQVKIIERLRPSRIIFAFDLDAAGIRNIEIASKKLRKYPIYVMRYPKGRHDPAELTRREAYSQVKKAISLHRFTLNVHRSKRKELHGTH